jgi:hypothetical protein
VLLVAGVAGAWAATPLDAVKSQLVFLVWLAAAVVAVAGLLLCVPALLAGIGRLVGRTPAAFRMAVRELSRQRGRATATVAAIVGGTLLIGVTWTLVTSIEADQAREWVAARPYGQAEVNTERGSLASIQAAAAVVHGVDPSLRTAPLAGVDSWSPDGSADNALPIGALRPGCTPEDAETGTEDRCLSLGGTSSGMLAGSVDDLAWLFGLDATQRDALAKGHLLVNTDRSGVAGDPVNEIVDGNLELAYLNYAQEGPARIVRVPALGVTGELITRGTSVRWAGALVSAETAAERGWLLQEWSLRVVDPAGPISAEAADRLNAALADHDADLRVERGFEPAPSDSMWVLTSTLAPAGGRGGGHGHHPRFRGVASVPRHVRRRRRGPPAEPAAGRHPVGSDGAARDAARPRPRRRPCGAARPPQHGGRAPPRSGPRAALAGARGRHGGRAAGGGDRRRDQHAGASGADQTDDLTPWWKRGLSPFSTTRPGRQARRTSPGGQGTR